MTTPSSPYPNKAAWPVNWQASGLTGKFVDFNGDPIANATIVLTPSVSSFTSQATNTVVIAVPRTITTDSNGSINLFVPATDDPDIQPVGWTYKVEEKFGALRTYNIEALVGQVLDLSRVLPTPVSDGVTTIRGEQGVVGAVGPQGVGVPIGGPAGTVLSKMSANDYDTIWLSVDTNGSIVGPSAYDLAVSNGFTGTLSSWLDSLRGPLGPPGVAGAAGPVGNTGPTGPAGVSGVPGPTGASAYQHAVSLGFVGSEGSWLETLRGAPGRGVPAAGAVGQVLVKNSTTDYDLAWAAGGTGSGGDGASAYEVAVINGYVGTEPEWIASLEGPPGPIGSDGPAGPNGPTGATGPAGPIGATGLRGPQGVEGVRGPIGATGPAGSAFTPSAYDGGVATTIYDPSPDYFDGGTA